MILSSFLVVFALVSSSESMYQVVVVRNLTLLTDHLNTVIEQQRNSSDFAKETADAFAALLRQQNYQDNHILNSVKKLSEDVSEIRQIMERLMTPAPAPLVIPDHQASTEASETTSDFATVSPQVTSASISDSKDSLPNLAINASMSSEEGSAPENSTAPINTMIP